MPTNPANARILLKKGKAEVISRTPFAIRLLCETTEYTQPITVGIDDGGVKVGIAAISGDNVLYQEELTLRTDIRKLMDTRRQYRRSRRCRKTRYGKPRFLNRKSLIPICKVCGKNAPKSHMICRACLRRANGMHQKYAHIRQKVFRLPPSIKAKKDAIVRAVRNIPLPTPSLIRIEDAYFDFQTMENPGISGEQYQHGALLWHKNFKTACLTRDNHKCRVCGAKSFLQCHHIRPIKKGGTDKLSNLMTLCESCHEKHHKEGSKLPKQKNSFYISGAHVQQGKNYLRAKLGKITDLQTTFGYITSYFRNKAGLEKSHVSDAVVIASKDAIPEAKYLRTKHVRSRKRSLHEATARKGRKTPNRTQKRNNKNIFTLKGFDRWDTVRYRGKVGFISGFTGTSGCYIVDIEGNYVRNPAKKYKQVSLREVTLLCKNQTIISY